MIRIRQVKIPITSDNSEYISKKIASKLINENSVELKDGNQKATITPGNNTEVTYNVTLSTPGDFYEFDVDV